MPDRSTATSIVLCFMAALLLILLALAIMVFWRIFGAV
jgi:hypothetical protein